MGVPDFEATKQKQSNYSEENLLRDRGASSLTLEPAKMPTIATVDERFQSFNVEMVEVIGGRFWKPYNQTDTTQAQPPSQSSDGTPAGMDANLYQYRPPIDLSNPRLQKLAAALGPSYVRVSGTWANTVYFQDSDEPKLATPPEGFNGVLTRQQWKGVIDFAQAIDAKLVTSFATSPGTRDATGAWIPDQARQLLNYTHAIGGSIAAAEFMNEPTYAAMGGAPKGYDAIDYGRDIGVFRSFINQAAPEMLFLGPGSVGEGGALAMSMGGSMLKTEDLLAATGSGFDVFSYHLYAAASERCASLGAATQTTAAAALSAEWLSQSDTIHDFYAKLRDRFEPDKPIWITETADSACGGNPWASTFLDTFRYLDQHGRLAQRGVQVIAHNTLASSDYGLLDENTLVPRPKYWAALLWHQFMGTTVLNPGLPRLTNLYLYAHALRGSSGVALLIINTDPQNSYEIAIPTSAERYTLTAKQLLDTTVQLNGSTLQANSDGSVPQLVGSPVSPGHICFEPTSITFLVIPDAGNPSF